MHNHAVEIQLHIRVKPERRAEFDAFLQEAVPYYEELSGVFVRLIERKEEPGRLIEVVEYMTREAYEADKVRMETDSKMKGLLARWRGLLDGPPEVRVYEDVMPRLWRIPY